MDISRFSVTVLIALIVFLVSPIVFWYFRRRAAMTLTKKVKEGQGRRKDRGFLYAGQPHNKLASMTNFLRVFATLFFALPGVGWLVIGAILIPLDSTPVQELRQNELEAISIAARHVSEHHSATGSYPTDQEFKAWADEAHKSPTPLWSAFRYKYPLSGRAGYSFELWDGDCTSTWYSEPIGSTKAYSDPECTFVFGRSKLTALIWCFVYASVLLGISYFIAKPLLPNKRR